MSTDREPVNTGWVISALFDIPATQELADNGELPREDAEVDQLRQIWELMGLIAGHSQGRFLAPDITGVKRKTRVYCNADWVMRTDFAINNNGQLDLNIPLSEGQWWDPISKTYIGKIPRLDLKRDEETICGGDGIAVTNIAQNAITFCPQFWERIRVSRLADMPEPSVNANAPTIIDSYQTISTTWLHEYCHVVGKSSYGSGPGLVPDIYPANEFYGWDASEAHARQVTASEALKNADSYALLGIALYWNKVDWREGEARSPEFWERARRSGSGSRGSSPAH